MTAKIQNIFSFVDLQVLSIALSEEKREKMTKLGTVLKYGWY